MLISFIISMSLGEFVCVKRELREISMSDFLTIPMQEPSVPV